MGEHKEKKCIVFKGYIWVEKEDRESAGFLREQLSEALEVVAEAQNIDREQDIDVSEKTYHS